MCGRYVIAQDVDAYARFFRVNELRTESLSPNYNVAPTDRVYAVAVHEKRRLLGTFRWGLIPTWASKPNGHINARAETVAEKPTFRDSFFERRCIMPADGFYEWQQLDRGKLPHFVRLRDGSTMAFAGLWSIWRDPAAGDKVRSCTIITTAAHPSLARIHGRMPVMLAPEVQDEWLNSPSRDRDYLLSLLQPVPETILTAHSVSTLVNDVRNNLPECIEPLVSADRTGDKEPPG